MKGDDLLTGPIAITGADGHVGRALQRRLAQRPNPVRAVNRAEDWSAAIRDVDALIHLAGTLQPGRSNTYEQANVGTVERCLGALTDSSLQRLVFLSYVGADPGSPNEYLRSKGNAEQLIRDAGIPHVIFRSTLIYGGLDDPGPSFASYRARPGGSVSMLGDGTQRVAPIHVEDLSGLLVAAALDLSTPTGTFDVSGADTFTLDEFVSSINPADVRIRHLPPSVARLLAWLVPQLTPALVDVLLSDSTADHDPVITAEAFGVALRRFDGEAADAGELT